MMWTPNKKIIKPTPEQSRAVQQSRAILNRRAHDLSKLHSHLKAVGRYPHEGQKKIIRTIFNDNAEIVIVQCGRNWGKTEGALYCTWRYAICFPGSFIWIICPEIKQGHKVYWATKRIQNYGPREFLDHRSGTVKSELTINFKNGSSIMVDGCENLEANRGPKPQFVVYEETKDHTEDFHEEVMAPNFAGGNVQLLSVGTPPKRHCFYVEFREDVLHRIAEGDPDKYYFEVPSSDNPRNSKKWLAETKDRLIRHGKLNTWLREYEGKLVFDIEGAIFPMWDSKPGGHIHPHTELIKRIERVKHRLDWYAVFDPGTAACFAVLFAAINRYSGELFILREIYETTRALMNAVLIWKRSDAIKRELTGNPDVFLNIYDEAAAWFANEVINHYRLERRNIGFIPTKKAVHRQANLDSRPGESIIMNAMTTPGKFNVSDSCEKFKWEIEQYQRIKNKAGNLVYPKTHDHLMDDLHYLVLESGYSVVGDIDYEAEHDRERIKKPATLQQEIDNLATRHDIIRKLDQDYDRLIFEEGW